MKVKLQVTILLMLFSLLASLNATVARTWVPGVATGDYFYYEMYGVYTSNRSNTTMVIPQFEYNNTDWARINITDVSSSMIYQVYTLHFKNGSETSFNFKTDVNPANESNLKFYEKGVPICAANLGAGDFIPTAQLTINETIIRAYPSGSRETNHAAWNNSDDWGNCYFDKETGMLVELCRTHKFTNNVTDEIVEKMDVIKMLSSNRWEINVSPPIAPLFVFLTVAIFALLSLVILIHKLCTKKTRHHFTVKEMAS